jgi:hypothetical protein
MTFYDLTNEPSGMGIQTSRVPSEQERFLR